MTSKSEIEPIEARQRQIAQEMERLQKEADELEVALRVLKRFSPSNGAAPKLGPARPANGPTLFEMTEKVLSEAERRGRIGLSGRDLVTEIGSQFWPGVKSAQILPTIYQYAKKGRLKKTSGGLFKLPHKNETPPKLEGAS